MVGGALVQIRWVLGASSTKNSTLSFDEGISSVVFASLELGEADLWGRDSGGEGVFATGIILATAVAAAKRWGFQRAEAAGREFLMTSALRLRVRASMVLVRRMIGVGDYWLILMFPFNPARLIYSRVGLNPFILGIYS